MAIQIPEEIRILRKAKDLFLAGIPFPQICKQLLKIKKPRRSDHWSRQTLTWMLLNRFYVGTVDFGRTRLVKGKRIFRPNSEWTTGKGKHKPVWSEEIYNAIVAEFERREGSRTTGFTYAISGLLTCSICDTRLHRHGRVAGKRPVYMSCQTSNEHITIEYAVAHRIVAQKVVGELKKARIQPQDNEDEKKEILAQISEKTELRATIQAGYEKKIYREDEAGKRIVSIETEIDRLQRKLQAIDQRQQHHRNLLNFARQDLEKMQEWILTDDPTKVNHLLTSLCEKIIITPEYQLEIIFR